MQPIFSFQIPNIDTLYYTHRKYPQKKKKDSCAKFLLNSCHKCEKKFADVSLTKKFGEPRNIALVYSSGSKKIVH